METKTSPITDPDAFRDTLSNLNEDGSRKWIHAKIPSGKYHTARVIFGTILLIILFAVPFIRINGLPLFQANILERHFIIFGKVYFPQDLFIVALGMLSFVVGVVAFTVVYGRLWCGWACPQTIFMELVFRKIETWIEGTPTDQKRLKAMPWTGEKLFKKGLKHTIFLLISFVISNLLFSYIVGTDKLGKLIADGPMAHLGTFIGIWIFTGVFYFVFAKFRELACIVVCPYGRLQGVMLDANSIVIAYDWVRGEPRAKGKKKDDSIGDCIDCGQCVAVCPTGIDIRNGTQLECINCTACIDACDDIMRKLNRPEGLIRYASLHQIEKKEPFRITPRMIAYSVVLVLLLSGVTYMIVSRNPIETTLMRAQGQLYQLSQDEKTVSNLYNFQVVNKTRDTLSLELKALYPGAQVKIPNPAALRIPPSEVGEGVCFIEIPRSELKSIKTTFKVAFLSKGEELEQVKTSFLAPQ
ncbi:MAG: cytochrome c oxidase accessory protein CcoG [Bacteroidia bacterium]|nr:cytochrome c oxidase accessory protein CcoG [Bacteroidia bacterium]